LKFDEYKYARAGVPFKEKWNLQIERNLKREQALFSRLVKSERYIVCQRRCSYFDSKLDISGMPSSFQLLEIGEETDSVFDWLAILERASALILVDSCFANIAEQLEIPIPKLFLFRSEALFTPVLRDGWSFSAAELSRKIKERLSVR